MRPFQYEQFTLNENIKQYLKTSLMVKKVFRMGIQKTPLRKFYELFVSKQNYKVNFTAVNWHFDWFKISLIYDKSHKHAANYESYNGEVASTSIHR